MAPAYRDQALGFVLVLMLWLLVLISMLSISVLSASKTQLQTVQNYIRTLK